MGMKGRRRQSFSLWSVLRILEEKEKHPSHRFVGGRTFLTPCFHVCFHSGKRWGPAAITRLFKSNPLSQAMLANASYAANANVMHYRTDDGITSKLQSQAGSDYRDPILS